MPSENDYRRVSFQIEKGLFKRFLQALDYEHVHSQSEGLRAAVREYVWNVMERQDKEALVKEINELRNEITLIKSMYIKEKETNGVIKKELHKKIKKEIQEDSKNIEDNLF